MNIEPDILNTMVDHKYLTNWRDTTPPPLSIKNKARYYIRYLILSLLSAVNRSRQDKFLRCIYCHYVFDDQKDQFARFLLKLKSYGEFVDTKTCIQMLKGEKPIDKRYFHLSFDDGFRNNFLNAFPILRKLEVPALFFVPTSLVDADWEAARRYCFDALYQYDVVEVLHWQDLIEMISAGYEIGSHTKTHAKFTDLSTNPSWMEEEIAGSKQILEAKLGIECKYISWPYGNLIDVDEKSISAVKAAGYTACFGAFRGAVIPKTTDIFRIPRHHFEIEWPLAHIEYFARGNMELPPLIT